MTSDLETTRTIHRDTTGISTADLIGRVAAGLIAGFIGFYAGLFALLSIWGLNAPSDVSATAMVASACLFGFFAIGLVARRGLASSAIIGLAGLALGAIAGYINEITVDSFEVAIAAAATLILGAAVATR